MAVIVSPTPGTHFTNGLSTASQFNISNATDPVAYNTRWQWNLTGAESTANAGSNLQLQGIADDGFTIINTPITVNRATGAVTLIGPEIVTNDITAITVTAAKIDATANPSTTRDIYGKVSLSYPGTVTVGGGTGSIVGTRGEVAVANAATVLDGGYYYGAQGKITAVTGATVGAGSHAFGVMGQFDLSLATVSGNPQISPIWGDMGATSPASGWGNASSLLSSQNTTAAATNSHLYTYGKAAYYADIQSNGGAFVSTGAATPSGTLKKLKVNIDGVDLYILAAAVWS
jgi:hypothetical protein